jgi:uncharacterized protein with GYD domain
MPMYLGRFSYSSEAVKSMVENPEDRGAAARAASESLGCKMHGIWYAFGDWDGYFLLEAPDNSTAVALSARVAGSGAMHRTEMIPLVSMEEGMAAFRKAQSASYSPPGG